MPWPPYFERKSTFLSKSTGCRLKPFGTPITPRPYLLQAVLQIERACSYLAGAHARALNSVHFAMLCSNLVYPLTDSLNMYETL